MFICVMVAVAPVMNPHKGVFGSILSSPQSQFGRSGRSSDKETSSMVFWSRGCKIDNLLQKKDGLKDKVWKRINGLTYCSSTIWMKTNCQHKKQHQSRSVHTDMTVQIRDDALLHHCSNVQLLSLHFRKHLWQTHCGGWGGGIHHVVWHLGTGESIHY